MILEPKNDTWIKKYLIFIWSEWNSLNKGIWLYYQVEVKAPVEHKREAAKVYFEKFYHC